MSASSNNPKPQSSKWKAKPRKLHKRASPHIRKQARADAGLPVKVKIDGVYSDVPGGYVDRDRVFIKDSISGKEVYCDISQGKFGQWLPIGTNGVCWGKVLELSGFIRKIRH